MKEELQVYIELHVTQMEAPLMTSELIRTFHVLCSLIIDWIIPV